MGTAGDQHALRGGAVRGDAVGPPAGDDDATNPLDGLRPVGPAAVLDGGFELLSDRFGRLVGLTACLYLPVWLVYLLLLVGGGGAADGGFPLGPGFLFFIGASDWALVPVVLQVVALSMLGVGVGALAMARANGADLAGADLARLVLRRSWVAVLIVPLNLIVRVVMSCVPIAGPVLAEALVFMTSVVAGAEGIGPLAAIRRSVELSTRSFGRAVVISISGLVITQVLRLSFAFGPTVLFAALDPSSTLTGWLSFVGTAVLVVTEPLTACIAARAYLDLRCRLEGLDLLRRLQADPATGRSPAVVGGPRL